MKIFDIPIENIKKEDLYKKLEERFFDKQKTMVTTPNPEILNISTWDISFREMLKKGDINIPDGIGLYIAYQLLEQKNIFMRILLLPYFVFNIIFRKKYIFEKYGDKICGSDLTLEILKIANEKGIKIGIIDPYIDQIYTIGDKRKKESQEIFNDILSDVYPKLDFKLILYKNNLEELYEEINKEEIQIAFCTLGMGKQELVSYEILQNTNCLMALGIGSSFDYITGFQKRAPEKYRDLGLEWLYRLLSNGGKWRRIQRLWDAIIVFTYRVIVS